VPEDNKASGGEQFAAVDTIQPQGWGGITTGSANLK